MEIKSIFDGWTKQFACGRTNAFGSIKNGDDCAATWISKLQWTRELADTVRRLAVRIRPMMPKDNADTADIYCLVYANNELAWTPEDFRRIDRETQIETAVKPLVDSVQEVQEVQEVNHVNL